MLNILKKIKKGLLWFSKKFGYVNSTIILTIVYVVFFGIYGLLKKFFGLFAKKQPKVMTMWRQFETKSETLEDLKNEF